MFIRSFAIHINMNERMNGQKGCVIASFDTNLF